MRESLSGTRDESSLNTITQRTCIGKDLKNVSIGGEK